MEPFNLKKFLLGFVNPTTWSKTVVYLIIGGLIVFMLICVKNFFFPTKSITNKPHALVIGKAEKGAIDQTSTNIVVEKEKPFKVGAGAGVMRYDNKDGAVFGVFGEWKF
jgi:hypothetical protein